MAKLAEVFRLFVMANTAAKSVSDTLTVSGWLSLVSRVQETKMTTCTNRANASVTLTRIAEYVGHLIEGAPADHAIEAHHFESPQRASRGLNRHYELGELMSRTIVP